ncbi:MAG: putative outer rane phospholipase, partial [Sphingomonas bacterium]
ASTGAAGAALAAAIPAPAPAPVSTKPEQGNAFLGNLSSYAPIYAVYGPGTDSDARLQISFKYQLFGSPGAVGMGQAWENGIHFAFTQRMFWNLGRKSSPFRSVDFMPEVFYLLPATSIGADLAIGAQAGFRHESNGREGLASRSLNTVYVQPVATTTFGGLTASAGPRLWLYAGSLEENPDIRRYRGNTGLFAEIGRPDGWRLTTNSRLNPGSGKGAVDAELSYPLDRIVDTNLNFYVFGQAFTGYGENLLDYNRSLTRVRIGLGIVR